MSFLISMNPLFWLSTSSRSISCGIAQITVPSCGRAIPTGAWATLWSAAPPSSLPCPLPTSGLSASKGGNQPASLHYWGGGYLVQPDSLGQVTISMKNCSLVNLKLQQNDFNGSIENVQDCEARELNLAYLQAVAKQREAS